MVSRICLTIFLVIGLKFNVFECKNLLVNDDDNHANDTFLEDDKLFVNETILTPSNITLEDKDQYDTKLNSDEYEDHTEDHSEDNTEDDTEDDHIDDDNNGVDSNLKFISKGIEIASKHITRIEQTDDTHTKLDAAHYKEIKAHKSWIDASKWTHGLIEEIIKENLPLVLQLSDSIDLSPQCISSVLKIVTGIRNQEPWAWRYLDSMFRPTSGFLEGTITDFGDFDECLRIRSYTLDAQENQKVEKVELFRGQYCLLNIRPALPPKPYKVSVQSKVFNFTDTEIEGTVFEFMAYRIAGTYDVPGRAGICLPSTCTMDDLRQITKLITNQSNNAINVSPPEFCQVGSDGLVLNVYQIISISIIFIMLMLVVIGTITEMQLRLKFGDKLNLSNISSVLKRLILAFSARSNCKKLFSINEDPNNLSAIHGIRVFTVFWAVTAHTYGYGSFSPWLFRNLVDVVRKTETISYQFLSNAFILVDSFFLIGGLTLAFITLPHLIKNKGRINLVFYVFHRWFRSAPTLTGAILFVFLMPLFISSPYFPDIEFIPSSCEKNWLYSYLFIQNWFKGKTMCLVQAWYLSADTQLYLFALIILIPLSRSFIAGSLMIIVSIIVGIIISGVVLIVNDLPPSVLFHLMNNFDNIDEYLQYTYYPTYQHLSTYCIGIAVGYFIYKYRHSYISNRMQKIGWFLSFTCLLSVIFIPTPWSRGYSPSPLVAASYAALHRPVWSLGLSWIIFACVSGRGGIINDILSAKVLVPLSRLSFGIYLFQIPIIGIHLANISKDTQIWSDFDMISRSVSNFIWSIALAFVCFLLFEAPFANIEKVFTNSKSMHLKKEEVNQTENNHKKSHQIKSKERSDNSKLEQMSSTLESTLPRVCQDSTLPQNIPSHCTCVRL